MKHHTLILTAIGIAAAVGCGKKADDKQTPAVAEAAATIDDPGTPAAPTTPAFSEEAAKKLIGELAGCKNQHSCDPLDALISFGSKVSAMLADIATDASLAKEQRTIALHGLSEIKDPAVGIRLFEAGKTEADFMLRSDLFKAAGASGGDATFAAMIAEYASDASKEYRTELGFGVDKFDKTVIFAYASSNYPDAEKDQIRFANLVRGAAPDASTVQPLLDKTKNQMARHRLASAMVALGDASKLDILVAGLSSKNEYDRADAGNMLGAVADKVPAERKTEIIDLVTAAKAKDKGGLTSAGYDKILKTLAK